MNRLPPEILTSIFTLLYQRDKVECMTVCQKWVNIIEDFCLFNTVFIYNQEAFEYLIKKYQERPEQGAQVKNLIIDTYHYGSIELNDLTLLLPNLRLFYISTVENGFLITPVVEQPWNDCIEYLMIYNNPILFKKLFSINKFSQLKYLTANGKSVSDPTSLHVLPDLTQLTELLIQDTKISFSLLESIHNGAPQLKVLHLDYSEFKNDRFPFDIQSVIPLSKLHITADMYISIEAEVDWLKYISRKYPNLSDLKLHRLIDSELLEDEASETKRVLLSEHYKNFFQKQGTQLKKLYLKRYGYPQDLFKILDDTHCELQKIALYTPTPTCNIKYIAASNQRKHIKSLKLGSCLRFDTMWISEMSALKKLSISFETKNNRFILPTPRFSRLLDVCPPTLEKIKLSFLKMDFDGLPNSCLLSIKSLSLYSVCLQAKFSEFLVNYLPRLVELSIIHCQLDEPKIALPNHHLLRFEFNSFELGALAEVLVITSKAMMNEKTIYKQNCPYGVPAGFYINHSILPSNTQTKRMPYDPSIHQPTITLEYATIVDVFVLS